MLHLDEKKMINSTDEAGKLARELFILKVTSFTDCTEDELKNLYLVAKEIYYNSEQESLIIDEEFDALERYLTAIKQDVSIIGSETRGGKVDLPYAMGGLIQIYEGEAQYWVSKHDLVNEEFIITEKLDGNSILLIYNESGQFTAAFSKGRSGTEGADNTRHMKYIDFPKSVNPGKIRAVRGEVIVKKSMFDSACKAAKREYKNPRNMVSGLMNASDSSPALPFLDIVAYDLIDSPTMPKDEQLNILISNGFKIPNHFKAEGESLTDEVLTKNLEILKNTSPYELDGIVIDLNRGRENLKQTADTLDPEYARKYKVADESNLAITTVRAVEWNVSKTGYLKPTVVMDPVDLVGVTISRATGFNAGFIRDNEIGPGARIKITRSGDVIPFITDVVAPMPVDDYPDWLNKEFWKLGEWEWTDTMVDAYLVSDHPEIAVQKTLSFFTTIGVDGLKEGNIRKLFDAGVKGPVSIIKASERQLTNIVGENGKKIYTSIRAKLNHIQPTVLMAATGLFGRGVGTRKLLKLWETVQGDETIFCDEYRIVRIDGFEEATAEKIVDGYPQYKLFLEEINGFVTLSEYKVGGVGGPLTGQVYVFTGFRDKDLQAAIESLGGVVGDGVTSKTTCVVAKNPNERSGKLDKARAKGITVVGVDDLRQQIGE
jgi:NAD-dependent DNA ligase